jgi:hypothetical protein
MRAPIALVASSLLLGSLLAACSSSVGSYCSAERSCAGGTDESEKACVNRQNGLSDIATAKGCPNAYSEYLSCLATNAKCESKQLVFPRECQAQYDAVKLCGVQL